MGRAMPGAFAEALRGDLGALSSVPAGGDWDLAYKLLRWLAAPDAHTSVPMPGARDVATNSATHSAASEASAWAWALRARIAWLTLDRATLQACAARLQEMRDDRAPLFAAVVRRQLADLAGTPPEDDIAAVQERARTLAEPTLVVEAAFASVLCESDARRALSRARLACRMAQSEGQWLTHYSTALLLARSRRMTGQPHLAAMIARACLGVAPGMFRGRLRWELLHAGVEPRPEARSSPKAESNLAAHLAACAAAWLCHGDPEGKRALDEGTEAAAAYRADWSAVRAATSTSPDPPTDPMTQAWLEGRTSEVPPVLTGLIAPGWSTAGLPPLVLGTPGRATGRRVLGYPALPEHPVIAPVGARAARPEAVMAALTIAGSEGIDLASLFADAYGFAYRPELHEATFKVVRHQARKQLEDHAIVERDDGRLRLHVERPYAVFDPRVRQPLSHTVLRALVAGADSAKTIASQLGVPLRTVQMTLKDMVDEGACVAQREGRRVQYIVEDTTFCEITRA